MSDGKMCSYYDTNRGAPVEDRAETGHYVHPKTRRKRVACPVCKRRLVARVAVGYDDELRYVVPKHKRKRWWRKPKHGSS